MTPAEAWTEAATLLEKGKDVEILLHPRDTERGTRIVLYAGEGETERFIIFVGMRRISVGESQRSEYVARRLDREAGRRDLEVREYAGYKEKVETVIPPKKEATPSRDSAVPPAGGGAMRGSAGEGLGDLL